MTVCLKCGQPTAAAGCFVCGVEPAPRRPATTPAPPVRRDSGGGSPAPLGFPTADVYLLTCPKCGAEVEAGKAEVAAGKAVGCRRCRAVVVGRRTGRRASGQPGGQRPTLGRWWSVEATVIGGATLLLAVAVWLWVYDPASHRTGRGPEGPPRPDPDAQAREVMDTLSATQRGRDLIARYGDKDAALTAFQRARGISDEVAEAAIKEWVETHGRNFDWDLDEVMAICIRNQRDGIPFEYLPEAVKQAGPPAGYVPILPPPPPPATPAAPRAGDRPVPAPGGSVSKGATSPPPRSPAGPRPVVRPR